MRLRLLISLSCLLFLMWQRAGAQLAPADDFFHSGAQFYISNNVPAALNVNEQINLVTSSGARVATPSAPDAEGDGFNVCTYASTC